MKLNGTSLLGVDFVQCKIMGVSFIKSSSFGLDVRFTESVISNCNFSGMKMKKSIFRQCEISDTDFIDSDLTGSDFSGSTFSGAVFNHTNLSKTDFTEARGYLIHPLNNVIKKAIFSMPDAVSLIEQLDVIIR
jgi:uncharacterized protein YjbI with pentapeptide repeats